MLDRPGGRSLLAVVESGVQSAGAKRPVSVWPEPPGWKIATGGRSIVWPTLDRPDLVAMAAETRDVCFYAYEPRPGDVVVDIGAGVGEEMQLFSAAVGPTGRVIAVEAHPFTYALLVENVARWGLSNVTTVQAAITDQPGTVTLTDDGANVGNRVADEGVAVPATTIDALVVDQGLDRVDLLKMNIEGAETAAIAGMRSSADRIVHVCVSCHDFLVPLGGPPELATSADVRPALLAAGFDLRDRPDDERPWVRYYLYGQRSADSSSGQVKSGQAGS